MQVAEPLQAAATGSHTLVIILAEMQGHNMSMHTDGMQS